MTNYEYYKEQLEEIWLKGRNIAVDTDDNIIACGNEIECKNCIFNVPAYNGCAKMRENWFKQEHAVKLKDDLSNLCEYALSRNVVIEFRHDPTSLLSLDTYMCIRKRFTRYYIEVGLGSNEKLMSADDIVKVIDVLYDLFPNKEESHE